MSATAPLEPERLAAKPIHATWTPGEHPGGDPLFRVRLLRILAKHCSQAPIAIDELLAQFDDEVGARIALDVMIAERDVVSAVVGQGCKAQEVVYPVGRLPSARPGPNSGSTAKRRPTAKAAQGRPAQ